MSALTGSTEVGTVLEVGERLFERHRNPLGVVECVSELVVGARGSSSGGLESSSYTMRRCLGRVSTTGVGYLLQLVDEASASA